MMFDHACVQKWWTGSCLVLVYIQTKKHAYSSCVCNTLKVLALALIRSKFKLKRCVDSLLFHWLFWYFTFRIMVGMAQRWNSFGNWWERKKTCLWLVWKSCKRLSMQVHMYMLNSYRENDFSFSHILWYTGKSSRYDSNIKLYFVIFSCRCLVGVRTVLYWRNGTDWWDIPHSWCFWAGFGDCWTPCGSGFQFMGGIQRIWKCSDEWIYGKSG